MITMKEMLEAGVHFGHQTRRWNPKMKPYIWGARNGIHIVNLQKTMRLFRDAISFVERVAARGDTVLFIGTKRQAQDVMEQEARRAKMPFVTHRWLGGMLTNFSTIRKSIDRIDEIDKLLAEGSVEKLPKKEVLLNEKARVKLLRSLSGVREMKRLPGAVFIIDPRKEHIAVREARRLGIPAIGLADTNCDPDDLDFVIPGNDDAIRAIRLFACAIADTCLAGQAAAKERAAQEYEEKQAPAVVMDDTGATTTVDTSDREVEIIRR